MTIPGLVSDESDPLPRIHAVADRPLTFRTGGPRAAPRRDAGAVLPPDRHALHRLLAPVLARLNGRPTPQTLSEAAARRARRRTPHGRPRRKPTAPKASATMAAKDWSISAGPGSKGRSGRESKAAPFSYQLKLPPTGAAAIVVTYRGASNQIACLRSARRWRGRGSRDAAGEADRAHRHRARGAGGSDEGESRRSASASGRRQTRRRARCSRYGRWRSNVSSTVRAEPARGLRAIVPAKPGNTRYCRPEGVDHVDAQRAACGHEARHDPGQPQ